MNRYQNINNIVGWVTFLIAATVYCLTIEPTASFWDCPEFITTGYKLEVGHPPGAPFFMLVANLFTQLTSDATQVAKMVNYMSALMSGACILFLFWTITHLAGKLIIKDEDQPSLGQIVTVMGCGLVGALAYTFSDTFWFSAVEGEVYAFSSLFTAVVFWLILKWEDISDQTYSDRYLILISYLTGLSIGVHLLNLLCLPAIVLVYYYKKTPNANAKGSLLALTASALLVAAVLYGIVPGLVKVCGWFELFFVNKLSMGFNSGVYVYIIVLAASLIWSIWESIRQKSQKSMALSFTLVIALLGIPFFGHGVMSIVLGVTILLLIWFYLEPKNRLKIKPKYQMSARALNTTLLSIMMMAIGYSSYALIVIRSTANTPMDQNSPEDIFTLGSYLNREQYGAWPLFYGQTYASKVALVAKDGYCEPKVKSEDVDYVRKEKDSPDEKDSYVAIPGRIEYEYAQNMLFPRMWSSTQGHPELYESWMDIKGKEVAYDQCGETIMVTIPTQWENIKFFFTYQLNFMYWRYFMWNFVGRQNDIQGNGEFEHGNWITGFNFIDNLLVGNQELLPSELKNNKGHNVFYGLPLILGLIGLFYQAYRGRKGIQQFWVVFFLFFMTGIAIVLYLNQTPAQPRERDYAYAASFYAFAIWIGLGVAALAQMLQEKARCPKMTAGIIATLVCILIPIQMASQTWDDHDRSDRYLCSDIGKNYLNSLQEQGYPIIYTNGDNDTFPLWYNQETEGYRTDARTCNLSYLATDWYIDQMKRPAYDSPSLPISWDRKDYQSGVNDYVMIQSGYRQQIDQLYAQGREMAENGDSKLLNALYEQYGENPYELKNIMEKWVNGKDESLRVIPTDSIVIKVDKEAVKRSGMLITGEIPEYMNISLKGKRALYKNELMMLEMLSQANWERPIYIAISVGSDNELGLSDHFIQEGLANRITPFDSKVTGVKVDSEKMYDNLMHKFRFGGMATKGIYLDENVLRMCYTTRRLFATLAEQLLKEGKREKALEVLDYVTEQIPSENVPYDYQSGAAQIGAYFLELGQMEKGEKVLSEMAQNETEYMTYYLSLDDMRFLSSTSEFEYHAAVMDRVVEFLDKYHAPSTESLDTTLNELFELYSDRVKQFQ